MTQSIIDDQKRQKERVLNYKSPRHDIPGDYNMVPNAVPPPGIEHFDGSNKIHNHVAYVNLLCGALLLFVGLTRLAS